MTNQSRDQLMHSTGTTPYETFSIILPSFFLVFITMLLIREVQSAVARMLLEFFLIVIPQVLFMTLFSHSVNTILLLLVLVNTSLCFVILMRRRLSPGKRPPTDQKRLNFLTSSKSTINILSVIAILAVDFTVFPRSSTKTLDYGYSLMDTGVGLYVFSNGVVAPELRGSQSTLLQTLKGIVPLIVIGGARVFLVREIDYHVPIVEYGVHWNFFITLAAVKIIAFLVLKVVSVKDALLSGVSLLIVHESILQLGVAEYVLSNSPRDNFFSANREGIASSLGYASLYFLSVSLGALIKSGNATSRIRFLIKLFAISLFLLWSSFVLEKHLGISRRLTNSSYCIWVLFIATFMTTLFYFSEIIYDYIYKSEDFQKVPLLYEAINYNGLVFFLVANLLTGFINIICNTLQIRAFWSLSILILYMFINCGVAGLLYIKQIKLKL